jgi:hypothetical protein
MKITQVDPGIEVPDVGGLRIRTLYHILCDLVRAPEGSRLVDLGAGHCTFSKVAVYKGFVVTAVDGRDERKPSRLDKVSFVKSDVREFDIGGFDVVLILGLLYHLTLDDQIDLLSRCPAHSDVVIDTQIHVPELVVQDASAARSNFADRLVSEGGYSGVLFPEVTNPMAAIGNGTSWWHTEDSLMELFRNTGFTEVIKVAPPYQTKYGARRWYVLRKSGSAD